MKYINDNELIDKMKSMNLSPDQKSIVDEAIRLLGHRQAHIDMLMGEWEPEEMSKEQFDNWASRQRRVPEESLPAGLRLTATKEERQSWLRGELDNAEERLQHYRDLGANKENEAPNTTMAGNNMATMRPRNPKMDALAKKVATSPIFEFENVCKSVSDAVAKSKQPNAVTLAAMQEADDIINGVVTGNAVGDYDTWFANQVQSALDDNRPSIPDEQVKEQIHKFITGQK